MNIIREFFNRPIAYHPTVAKAFGSVKLGILWSQLFYWKDKGKDQEGWIYKTGKDIYDETALSRKEQETARKIGKEIGVLEEKVSGQPPTLHYRLNIEKAEELIGDYLKNHAGEFKEKKARPENSISYLKELGDADIREMIDKFTVTKKFVLDRAQDVIDYCEAKGKRYSNYKAALRNFIKSELKDHPEAREERVRQLRAIDEEKKRKDEEMNNKPLTPEEQERRNEKIAKIRANLNDKFKMP